MKISAIIKIAFVDILNGRVYVIFAPFYDSMMSLKKAFWSFCFSDLEIPFFENRDMVFIVPEGYFTLAIKLNWFFVEGITSKEYSLAEFLFLPIRLLHASDVQ